MNEERATQLLSIASQGQLMAWLTTLEPDGEERRRAIDCLAQLHRVRRIDAFDHLDTPVGADEWRVDHLSWGRVYRDLFPLLDDEAARAIPVTVRLGTRSWEPTFHEALIDWCTLNRHRIDEVLALESLPDIPDFCFAAALIAGLRTAPAVYLNVAIDFAQGNRRSRMAGIRAIGAMSVQNDAVVQHAVTALGTVLDDVNAAIRDRADALTAALEVAQRCNGSLDAPVSDMVARATAFGQAELLQVCCHVVIRFGGQLRDGLRPSLLKALQAQDIDAHESHSAIDSALYRLFTQGRKEEALVCLEGILRKSHEQNPLDRLGSTTHYLTSENLSFLPEVACRWLLTGDQALCAAVYHLVTLTNNQRFAFDFDPGNRDWPGRRTIYLARKAIGWLMPHGTAPASFLVCLLRAASGHVIKELGGLLFDPLLVNYPLAARAYLAAVCPNLPAEAKSCVEGVLGRDDLYKQSIQDVGLVLELQPTDRQRWIENERHAEELAKARSEAESKSVLLQLVTRQSLLYGTRTIDYVDDPGGRTRRSETQLKTFSYTIDNSMGWVYDPVGLDIMIRIFRTEPIPE
jgi:hypothetical protein